MKQKYRVGLISFSDGREYVHKELEGIVKKFEDEIAKTLEETGEVEVIRAKEIVWKPSIAKKRGKKTCRRGSGSYHLQLRSLGVSSFHSPCE